MGAGCPQSRCGAHLESLMCMPLRYLRPTVLSNLRRVSL